MSSILEKLRANMNSYLFELKDELVERSKYHQQLQVLINNKPISSSDVDGVLSSEYERRTAGTQRTAFLLQVRRVFQHEFL